VKTPRPVLHNRDHRRGGADAINGRWYYVGAADAPDFENGWGNTGAGKVALRYGLDDDELVVAGDITGGTAGTVVFTLPASHTPDEEHTRPGAVSVDSALATIVIATDGTVTVTELVDTAATQAELDAHTGDTTDAHDASAISVDSSTLVGTGTDAQAVFEELDNAIAALGTPAPANADYLVGTANGTLTNEIVVGTSPGGELGGTWASPTVDATHSGSSHASVQSAAEATAAAALAAHEADTTSVHGIANTANLQPLDSDLTAIAALATTSYGRGLLTLADAAALSASLPGYSTYTPTWTSTGTAPDIGNSTVVARYIQLGKKVHCFGSITFGNTATFGTGNYRFALPVSAASNAFAPGASLYDSNTGNQSPVVGAQIITATTYQLTYGATYMGSSSAVSATTPWTWAQGDVIDWNFTYEAA
jgi:hypothetical protein